MKKKALLFLVGCLCAASLTGCGKSRMEKVTEFLQRDLEISREEAEDIAELFEEEDFEEEKSDKKEKKSKKEEKNSQYDLVEVSDEIVNSTIMDSIIQIYDAVIPIDGSMTLGEVRQAIDDVTGFDVKLGSNQSEDSLVEAGLSGVSFEDEDGEPICYFTCVNPTNAPMKLVDCPVISFSAGHGIHSLNTFYPGNICDGTNSYPFLQNTESPEYLERLKTYPTLKYEEIQAFLEAQGAEDVTFYNGTFSFEYLTKKPEYEEDGEAMYPSVTVKLSVDMSTAKCVSVYFDKSWYPADSHWLSYNVETLGELTDEQLDKLENDMQEARKEQIDEPIRLYGSIYEEGSMSGLHIISQTQSGQFLCDDVSVYMTYDGNIDHGTIQEYSFFSPETYSSIDELMEKEYIDQDAIIYFLDEN